MAWPASPMIIKMEAAFGQNPDAAPGSWTWTDITADVRVEDGVTVSRGRANETDTADPARISFALNNFAGASYTPRVPGSARSLRRGTPIRFSANLTGSLIERFSGWVAEATPRHKSKAGTVGTVAVNAYGILRRLAGRKTPLLSPLTRAASKSDNLVAYWPLDDGKNAESAANLVPGAAPMVQGIDPYVPRVKFGSYDEALVPAGMGAMPEINGGSLSAPVVSTSATSWRVEWSFGFEPAGIPDDVFIVVRHLAWRTTGGIDLWYAEQDFDSFHIWGESSKSGLMFGSTLVSHTQPRIDDGKVHRAAIEVVQVNPTTMNYWIYLDGALVVSTSNTTGAIIGQPQVGPITSVELNPWAGGFLRTLGGVGVWSPRPAAPINYTAALGYAGETAGARLTRLCAEEGIAITVDAGATSTMGPQGVDTLSELLVDCEQTDHGLLIEEGFGLRYIPRVARQNAAPVLTLTGSQLADDPQPVEDDRGIRNDVTVRRPSGSTVRYEDAANIATEGRYAGSADVNAPDAELAFHAQWLASLGTVDDMRYPQLQFEFANDATLPALATYLAGVLGRRIVITNLPARDQPNGVDVFVEGVEERYEPYGFPVALNCAPARPHEVLVVGSGRLGRLDTGGSNLPSGCTAGDTSLSVATLVPPLWTTTAAFPADFPLDVELVDPYTQAGERVTVTAISPLNEAFSRTVGVGWGRTPEGLLWTRVDGNPASDCSVNGAVGLMSLSGSPASPRRMQLPSLGAQFDVAVTSQSTAPTGAGGQIDHGLRMRYVSSATSVDMWLYRNVGSNSCIVVLRQTVGGVETYSSYATVPGVNAGASVRIRFAGDGDRLDGWAWSSAGTMPAAPLVTLTGVTHIAPGPLELYTAANSITNALPMSTAWDDLVIASPQIFTVTRGVNVPATAHPAGTAVRLWRPGKISL
ncbi:hypothetical protein ABT297_04025 [Dactylosporangium sp. NPDC000555]|uniref:hypothetical protein n=1 Tax=Dactylosporangium sp. NPDC000555 TaxID=3154260 RepID=UPI00332DB369